MPEINPELLQFMLETRGALGRIEAYQKAANGDMHVIAKKLDEHIADLDAHGRGERKEVFRVADRRWNTWSTTIMAAGAFADLVWRMFHKSARGP